MRPPQPPSADEFLCRRLRILSNSRGNLTIIAEIEQNARDCRQKTEEHLLSAPRPEALEGGAGQEPSLKAPRGQDGAFVTAPPNPQIPRALEGSGPFALVKHDRNCTSAVRRGQPGRARSKLATVPSVLATFEGADKRNKNAEQGRKTARRKRRGIAADRK